MPEGDGGAAGSEEKKGNSLWNLLPSYDPVQDNVKEDTDKVRFLWGICPVKDRSMLAQWLAMLCRGTAWSQEKALDPAKMTEPEGYPVQDNVKEDTDKVRFLWGICPGKDRSMLAQWLAMLCRGTAWSQEKALDPAKMTEPEGYRVLNQGDAACKKVTPVNMVDDEPDEVNYTPEGEQDEETLLAMLVEEGDEKAMVIQDCKDNIVQVCQESPALSMAFTAYQEASAKLKDKARIRGFWPLRQSSKGKGKVKKGKGFGKQRQTLADRNAAFHCRICGAKGHWKQECPDGDCFDGCGFQCNRLGGELLPL